MRIVKFAFDGFLIHICRYGVIDVKQRNDIIADTGSDELGQTAVNIHFTGYGDAHARQAAVYITGNKTKLCLESRPAFSCDGNIFSVASVLLDPVKQCQLVLSQFCEYFGFLVACAQFLFHLRNLRGNPLIAFMFVECFKQIQFGVLLDLNAQVVKLLDRCITCQEVQRSRSKADDL